MASSSLKKALLGVAGAAAAAVSGYKYRCSCSCSFSCSRSYSCSFSFSCSCSRSCSCSCCREVSSGTTVHGPVVGGAETASVTLWSDDDTHQKINITIQLPGAEDGAKVVGDGQAKKEDNKGTEEDTRQKKTSPDSEKIKMESSYSDSDKEKKRKWFWFL